MSRCTAPIKGHRTISGKESCPACGGRDYPHYVSYSQNISPSLNTNSLTRSSIQNRLKARWSTQGSKILYTSAELRMLTPIRENIEKNLFSEEAYDVFLCHAWDDRKDIAKDLYDCLESVGVSTWFSEKNIILGTPLLREIDKGLAKSKVGIVLVTPSFIKRIKNEGIADKELSALLFRDVLVPILHNTTYDDLRSVSPLLGSRSGLNTVEEPLEDIASKIYELVTI